MCYKSVWQTGFFFTTKGLALHDKGSYCMCEKNSSGQPAQSLQTEQSSLYAYTIYESLQTLEQEVKTHYFVKQCLPIWIFTVGSYF